MWVSLLPSSNSTGKLLNSLHYPEAEKNELTQKALMTAPTRSEKNEERLKRQMKYIIL